MEGLAQAGRASQPDLSSALRLNDAEQFDVRAQRGREHASVKPVILDAGHRKPVTKALRLLWIYREDPEASRNQGVDEDQPASLDGDEDLIRCCSPDQRRKDFEQTAIVGDASFLQGASFGVSDAQRMFLSCSVDPDVEFSSLHVSSVDQDVSSSFPVLALSIESFQRNLGRDFLLDFETTLAGGGACPGQALNCAGWQGHSPPAGRG